MKLINNLKHALAVAHTIMSLNMFLLAWNESTFLPRSTRSQPRQTSLSLLFNFPLRQAHVLLHIFHTQVCYYTCMTAAGLQGFGFFCVVFLFAFFSGNASIDKVQLSLNKPKSCTWGLPSIALTAGHLSVELLTISLLETVWNQN